MQRFLYRPFPKRDFAQPALGLDEPQGEVKVSVLRTAVQISEISPASERPARLVREEREPVFTTLGSRLSVPLGGKAGG